MKNEQIDASVFDAFLKREPWATHEIISDGVHLFAEGRAVAKWDGRELVVLSDRESDDNEAVKDALVGFIFEKIHREEALWRMVRPGYPAVRGETLAT